MTDATGGFTESGVIRFPDEDLERDSDIYEYFATMAKRVSNTALSGEIVAIQRNFDSDRGRVLDVYKGGGVVGFIEQDYDDMKCSVYVADEEGIPIPLDGGRYAFDEASIMLEGYAVNLQLDLPQ